MQTINNKPLITSSIRFLSGPSSGRVFQINKPITTIGRDPGNDIVIKDDLKVSSYHARLLWENGSWRIQKHPQAHRLTINSQVVQEAMITGNSTIGLGEDTSFLFLVDAKDHVSSEASAYSSQAQSSAVGSPLAAPTRPARANSQADQTQEDRRVGIVCPATYKAWLCYSLSMHLSLSHRGYSCLCSWKSTFRWH